MPELFDQYPTYEKKNFNPNREKIGQNELDSAKEALAQFPAAYADLLYYSHLKEQHKPGGNHTKDIGQIVGKMWLRCLEAMPVRTQESMVARTRQLMGIEENKAHFSDPAFLAGAMGEFATGVLLHESGLKIEYPEGIEDKEQSADLNITLPNGAISHVQAKTISLSDNHRRTNLEGSHLQIFSSLETEEDLENFCRPLRETVDSNTNWIERRDEIIEYAKIMHKQGRDQGFIPIFSLLMKPGHTETEASDIDLKTARPSQIAQAEAAMELDLIKQRYS